MIVLDLLSVSGTGKSLEGDKIIPGHLLPMMEAIVPFPIVIDIFQHM